MTIAEAITMIDALKPNKYTSAQKIRWLSDCDSTIFNDIISTHEAGEGTPEEFNGYTSETVDTTALLAPAPHDMLYVWYMSMQVDLANREMAMYQNTYSLFNTAMQTYAAYYNRTNMPIQTATHITL